MARVYAKCFEVAAEDVALAEADRLLVSEAYAVRAIELLRIAAERGLFLQAEDVLHCEPMIDSNPSNSARTSMSLSTVSKERCKPKIPTK